MTDEAGGHRGGGFARIAGQDIGGEVEGLDGDEQDGFDHGV